MHEELNRDLVIIPIRDRSKKPEVVYSKHDGVIVINITKPEQAECFTCKFFSVTLKSLTRAERSSKIPQDFSSPWMLESYLSQEYVQTYENLSRSWV